MSEKMIVNFCEYQTDIIIKALHSVAERVDNYYEDAIKREGEQHRTALSAKRQEIYDDINTVINLLTQNRDKRFIVIDTYSSRVFNIMRSALDVYFREISRMAERYNLEEYTKIKNEIENILKTNILKDTQTGLFDKYEFPTSSNENMEFFISYSSKDQNIAGKIREILVNLNFEVFVAHRDIPMSKEWREDILSHLESCSVLLAVCTANYESSTWGNQEVGIAIEKGKKVIPIFEYNINKSRFGFLEAIQGSTNDFTEDNLDKIIDEVIDKITR